MQNEILSQNKKILAHLKSGKSLTPLEALNKFGCLRLSARAYNLKSQGYKIITELVVRNGKRVAQYTLQK